MNIIILSFYYTPDVCAGAFRAEGLVKELNKKDPSANIYVFCAEPNRYQSFLPKVPRYEVKDNIHIFRSPALNKIKFLRAPLMFLLFCLYTIYNVRKIKNPDVVFATTGRFFTGILGLLISKIVKSDKYIIDVRDIFSDTLSSVKKNKIIKFLSIIIKSIEIKVLKKSSKVVFVSEGFCSYFPTINKEKIKIITNGIDEEFVDKNYDKDLSSNKTIKIVYAGNIGEGQGLEKILEGISQKLPSNYKIIIYGGGKYWNEILNISKKNNENIEVKKPVARKELIKIYKEADYLFLHLNNCSAFNKVLPSKIFEYAATGKPIIAGVQGYAKKFLNDEVGEGVLIFEPCNVEDFLLKLNKFNPQSIYERTVFINKFIRTKTSHELANTIYEQ